jgi:plastocyanin
MKLKKVFEISLFTVIFCFSIGLDSCKKDTVLKPGSKEVFIQGMSFSPNTITVSAGETITWTNKDNVAHTVTSNTPLFDSGSMGNGATFSFTFPSAGTFDYHCTFHAGMTGTVIVK